MDQEILLKICETIAKAEKHNTVEVLKKMIEDNKEVINDEAAFYFKVISFLADNLSLTTAKDKAEAKENELIATKLNYVEEMMIEHPNIGDKILMPLSTLCAYNNSLVNKFVIRFAITPGINETVTQCLAESIGQYYHNTTIVDFIIKLTINQEPFARKIIDGLVEKIKAVNFEAQVEFEKEAEDTDKEAKKEKQKNKERITNDHYELAKIMIKIFKHLGKEFHPKNEFFNDLICRNPQLNDHFYDIFVNIDICDTSELNFIDLANLFAWGGSGNLLSILIEEDKLPRENFDELKSINEMVNSILEQARNGYKITKKEGQFLDTAINSWGLYNINPQYIIDICEYLYGEMKLSDELEIEKLFEKDFMPKPREINERLATKMYNIVKELVAVGNDQENFFERLIVELLETPRYSEEYEKSILEIIDKQVLHMKYNYSAVYAYAELSYLICTNGTNEVIKATLNKYQLPIYICTESGGTDLFLVYTRLGEYDKALDILSNPTHDYEFVNPGEEYELEECGKFGYENAETYENKLSSAINLLYYNKDSNCVNFLNQVLASPKLTLVDTDVFERVSFLYRNILNIEPEKADSMLNQLSSYFRKRIKQGQLKMFVIVMEDAEESFEGIRLATPEEIEESLPEIGTIPSKQKKKVPKGPKENPDNQ